MFQKIHLYGKTTTRFPLCIWQPQGNSMKYHCHVCEKNNTLFFTSKFINDVKYELTIELFRIKPLFVSHKYSLMNP